MEECGPNIQPAIATHGGASAIPDEVKEARAQGVQRAAKAGYCLLREGGTAVDAVEAAIRVLEDDPVFDADSEVELDAIIMEGKELSSGAVTCVQNIKYPIQGGGRKRSTSLPYLIGQEGHGKNHLLLAGKAANQFAKVMGIDEVDPSKLVTEMARKEWEEYREFNKNVKVSYTNRADFGHEHETVGSVAIDKWGNVACGTSTGGITGSGAYCDNAYGGNGAVSTTGHGEAIMKVNLSKTVLSYMEHQGLSAQEAADKAVGFMHQRVGGAGGAIVVSSSGDLARSFSSQRMAWAFAKDNSVRYGVDPGDDHDGGKIA